MRLVAGVLSALLAMVGSASAAPEDFETTLIQHLVYTENFDNPDKHTLDGIVDPGVTGPWTVAFDNAALSYTNSTDSGAVRYFVINQAPFGGVRFPTDGSEVSATVTATNLQGGAAGLLVGYPGTNGYLVFAIGSSGYVILEKADGHVSIIDNGQNDIIHLEAANQLKVTQDDGTFHFFVNGRDLYDIARPQFGASPVGLAVVGKGRFTFDDYAMTPARSILDKLAPAADGCQLPPAADGDQVIAVNAPLGQTASTVEVAPSKLPTEIVTLDIGPGTQPLYLATNVTTPVIWRLRGATERISRFIAYSREGAVGVTGIDAHKVTLLNGDNCVLASLSDRAEERTFVRLSLAVNQLVDKTINQADLAALALPDGTVTEAAAAIAEGLPAHANAQLLISALERNPGGLVDLDPAAVVSSQPVERYAVRPGMWGLLQLIEEGKLAPVARARNSDLPQLRVTGQITCPPGLDGGRSVTLLLGPDTPAPLGDCARLHIVSDPPAAPLAAN